MESPSNNTLHITDYRYKKYRAITIAHVHYHIAYPISHTITTVKTVILAETMVSMVTFCKGKNSPPHELWRNDML